MFCGSVTVLALLSLAAGFTLREGDGATQLTTRGKREVPYHGPPAPLNHDGTVALTHEVQQVNAIHSAAFAHEFERLRAADSLAAAHPDRTSPPSPGYSHNHNGQYNSQQEDDGQYKPHLYENGQSNQQYRSGEYNPVPYKTAPYSQEISYTQQQYNHPPYNHGAAYNAHQFIPASYNQGSSNNPQAHVPAPLNPDGTAAQTPEYQAIAASLHAAYNQALTRHRRSVNHYHGPPAPLNHDGTVADTSEVQHANAIHKAAYAHEYQKLKEAETLAAAHPDLTSPPAQHYESHAVGHNDHQQYQVGQHGYQQEDDGQYKPHLYDEGRYNHEQYNSDHHSQGSSFKYNPEAHIPAPLNHDGTVAHTSAFKAVAASHHAEYEKALQTAKHQSIAPHFHTHSNQESRYY